jgi:OmpR-family two-component system manganese-sensing response regulator
MKVLLVEDHLPTRQMISRSLESQGHAVDGVGRMADGLNRAGESRFDSIIIDIELPDGTGLDLCREVRRRGVRTPILFLTARGEVEDRVSGLDAGADDYLKKPFALVSCTPGCARQASRAHTRAPQVIEGRAGRSISVVAASGGDTEISGCASEPARTAG